MSKIQTGQFKPKRIAAVTTDPKVSYWTINVGDSPEDKTFSVGPFDPPFATNPTGLSPFLIVVQTRQGSDFDKNYGDQFAAQVTQTTQNNQGQTDHINVRIRRLDIPGSGWGQKLELDFIIHE